MILTPYLVQAHEACGGIKHVLLINLQINWDVNELFLNFFYISDLQDYGLWKYLIVGEFSPLYNTCELFFVKIWKQDKRYKFQ